jgi:predicted AlkP superfamily pyrophosphatase or phosphodiesterase
LHAWYAGGVRALFVVAVMLPTCAGAAFTPKSLVVCFDGWRADAAGSAVTPTVERLATGAWKPGYRAFFTTTARVIDDAPSVSGPNHTAILTGLTARRSGVVSNADGELAGVQAPDYLRLLERRDPAAVTMKLAAWPPDGRIPSGADVVAIAPDATIVDRAAAALAGDVDALFLFLDGPDAAGHDEGFASAAYTRAVTDADAALARLLAVVAARPSFGDEDWQIVVTTDHGGVERDHGGSSAVETTIPFLVASRETPLAAEAVRNVDVAPTVLAHFGIDPVTLGLDGVARVPVTRR